MALGGLIKQQGVQYRAPELGKGQSGQREHLQGIEVSEWDFVHLEIQSMNPASYKAWRKLGQGLAGSHTSICRGHTAVEGDLPALQTYVASRKHPVTPCEVKDPTFLKAHLSADIHRLRKEFYLRHKEGWFWSSGLRVRYILGAVKAEREHILCYKVLVVAR